ncbi:MAG TPA: sugar-binding protein, partial [Pirellulales bacterium]|nr:sugar-binding protein [Pirellulales bacterium]
YPTHRLAAPALAWLQQYWSSGEVAVRQGQGSAAARFERAAAVTRQIERQFPTLAAEPSVQLPWLAQLRDHGPPGESVRVCSTMAHSRPRDAWWSCFAGEAWLADRSKAAPPKPIWHVRRSDARPKLDGQLDDATWHDATPVELRSPLGDDRTWPAEVIAAYDDTYLYLGIRCRQNEASNDTAPTGTRVRDPELSTCERVEILLDIDRDQATWFRLTADHRGWVAEDCWGDRSWNPSWYVAVDRQPGAWTIEAAMPLEALTAGRIEPGMAWSAGVVRIVPKVGFQSWTAPAAITPMPEGFGYLVFE